MDEYTANMNVTPNRRDGQPLLVLLSNRRDGHNPCENIQETVIETPTLA